ncbi:hypothetical protein Tco_0455784 [Tanacetum coccineum]
MVMQYKSIDDAVKQNGDSTMQRITFATYYGLLVFIGFAHYVQLSQDPKSSQDDGFKPSNDDEKKVDDNLRKDSECNDQEKEDNVSSTNTVNAASTNKVNAVGRKTSIELPLDPNMPKLEDYSIFDSSNDDEDVGAEADMNNLDTTIQVSPIPTTRIHKDHPLD